MERLRDSVNATVKPRNGVINFGFPSDATNLAAKEPRPVGIEHLDDGRDDVLLCREWVPLRVVGDDRREIRQWVAVWNVERVERRDDLTRQDVSIGREIVFEGPDHR